MLLSSEIDGFLEHVPPHLQDIILELRDIIASVAPTATEAVRVGGLSYYFAERGGPVSAGICQIGLQKDHLRLAFIHGAFLPDPGSLLEGERRYKRFIRLSSYEAVPWDEIKQLITASSRFDVYSLQVR